MNAKHINIVLDREDIQLHGGPRGDAFATATISAEDASRLVAHKQRITFKDAEGRLLVDGLLAWADKANPAGLRRTTIRVDLVEEEAEATPSMQDTLTELREMREQHEIQHRKQQQ